MLSLDKGQYFLKFYQESKMLITLLTVLACGDKTTDTATTNTDTNTTDTNTTDTNDTTEVDQCAGIEGSDGIGMTGSIVFEDGIEAEGNVRIQMCNSERCYVARWSDDGFCFPEGTLTANMPYAFDIVPTVDKEKYANPLTIITPSDSFSLAEPIVIPVFTQQGTNSADFDAGNGLIITADSNLPETVQSVPLDLESGGLPLEDFTTESIIGAWYLGPFDTIVEPAASITLSNDKIVAGITYTVHNGDYENKVWTQTAEVTASEDGYLEVSAAVHILSTMLITQ